MGRRQRFVPIESAEQQAALLLYRTRDLLIRQRSGLIQFDPSTLFAVRHCGPPRRAASGVEVCGILLAGQCDILVRSRIGVPWDQAKAGLGHTGADSVDECLLP